MGIRNLTRANRTGARPISTDYLAHDLPSRSPAPRASSFTITPRTKCRHLRLPSGDIRHENPPARSGPFLVASDACAAAGSGCLARSKADKMNRKRLNTSSMPSTSKIVRIQVNSAENEEIIESWLNESDESSANENDYIQSDRVVDSEDEYCDDEEATACDLDSASSEDDIPLSHIAGRTDRHVSVCSESDAIDESDRTQRRRKYYYGKNAA
ncbi:hypothetical protein EVAR_25359_1 [Eumeta japonica]|uniref:Uncharacterized protein n=1 Tax=Eumeta variegata TaxID=151549 RepID=A0A4C1XXV6_EUMVA|nr:hypothetical protein EVAR_25359_1 [Eumeta japonica]